MALSRLKPGLSSYLWLQEAVGRCDITTAPEFQRCFNRFYRVRRNERWREFYFGLLESSKTRGIDFPKALKQIKEGTNRVEASFASKLVATLDPTKPVIDRFVLQYFQLRLPIFDSVGREGKTIAVYNELRNKYETFMRGPTATLILELFESQYPGFNVTPLKRVDLVLWQVRP